jgi:hypothetical protein
MPEAQAMRLRVALQEFIASYGGDGGGAPRSAVDPAKAQQVAKAQDLLDDLSSSGEEKPESPGRRAARQAGSQGPPGGELAGLR